MLFTGEYEHTIDAKQRMAIPSEIRAQLGVVGGGADGAKESKPVVLYIVPGANGHLWLWPEETFAEMAGALEKSLLPGEELMEFEEFLFSQSRKLEIDKAGRVRLPDRMLIDAGLGQVVVILGVKDHLELRDPEQWNRQRKEKQGRQKEIMLRARKALEQQRKAEGERS
jgi:MraZ protein